jgi:hypothetical protein
VPSRVTARALRDCRSRAPSLTPSRSRFRISRLRDTPLLTRLGLIDEYQLTTVPIAIGAGHSPFAELGEHLKLDVVDEQRFKSGALAQILVPKQ